MSNYSPSIKFGQPLNETFLYLCKNLSQFIESEVKIYITQNLAQISKEFKNLNINWKNDIKTFIDLYKQKISDEEKIIDVFKDYIFLGYIKNLENSLIIIIKYLEDNKNNIKQIEENSIISKERMKALNELKNILNDYFDEKNEKNKEKKNKINKDILEDKNFWKVMNKFKFYGLKQQNNNVKNNNNQNLINIINSNNKEVKNDNINTNLNISSSGNNNINNEKQKQNNNMINKQQNNNKEKSNQKDENDNLKYINQRLNYSFPININNKMIDNEQLQKENHDKDLINNNINDKALKNTKIDKKVEKVGILSDDEISQLFEILDLFKTDKNNTKDSQFLNKKIQRNNELEISDDKKLNNNKNQKSNIEQKQMNNKAERKNIKNLSRQKSIKYPNSNQISLKEEIENKNQKNLKPNKEDNLKINDNKFQEEANNHKMNRHNNIDNEKIEDEVIKLLLDDYEEKKDEKVIKSLLTEHKDKKDEKNKVKEIKNNIPKNVLLKKYFESNIQNQFYIVNNKDDRTNKIKEIISSIKPNNIIKNISNKFDGPYLIGSYKTIFNLPFINYLTPIDILYTYKDTILEKKMIDEAINIIFSNFPDLNIIERYESYENNNKISKIDIKCISQKNWNLKISFNILFVDIGFKNNGKIVFNIIFNKQEIDFESKEDELKYINIILYFRIWRKKYKLNFMHPEILDEYVKKNFGKNKDIGTIVLNVFYDLYNEIIDFTSVNNRGNLPKNKVLLENLVQNWFQNEKYKKMIKDAVSEEKNVEL